VNKFEVLKECILVERALRMLLKVPHEVGIKEELVKTLDMTEKVVNNLLESLAEEYT
jgi:hypothetical protein